MINSLFGVTTLDSARYLRQRHLPEDWLIDQEQFDHLFKLLGGLWIYPGNPRPEVAHAVTRAEQCTNAFVNCMAVLEYANLCEILAKQLVRRLTKQYDGDVDLVIDAAQSGSDLGQNVALHGPSVISARHRTVEKDAKGDPTVFRGIVYPDEKILLVNELITTAAGSAQMAKNAVIKAGANPDQFVPFALIMVNRADGDTLEDGTSILSLASYDVKTYQPGSGTCPYCAAGSPRYKPKQGTNWQDHFSNC